MTAQVALGGSSGQANGSSSNGLNGSTHTNGGAAASSNGSVSSAAAAVRPRADKVLADDSLFHPLYEGSSLDRRELIRLAMQTLTEMGYDDSVRALRTETGVELEHDSIVAFRTAVLQGDWRNAEPLLLEGLTSGAARVAARQGAGRSRIASSGGAGSTSAPNLDVALRAPESKGLDSIKFLLHQQRYLELLEARQTKKALSILRERLAPLNRGSERLHQLSSLVMCSSPAELRARAHWEGTGETSRRKLLQDIESAVSPSIMVPTRRLPELLEQAQTLQKQRDAFFNLPADAHLSLYVDHRSDRSVFPTHTSAILTGHGAGQIWDLAWSHDGTRLATAGGKQLQASDEECFVVVWRPKNISWIEQGYGEGWDIASRLGPLRHSISCVAWSPDDSIILATSGCDVTLFWLATGQRHHIPSAHEYMIGSASWLPDGKSFITGAMDHKIVVRNLEGSVLNVINLSPFRILALSVSPDGRTLVAVANRTLPNNAASAAAQESRRHAAPAGSSSTGTGSQASYSYSESPSPLSATQGHAEDGEEGAATGAAAPLDLGGGSRTLGDEKNQIIFYDLHKQEKLGSVYMWDEMMSVCISGDSRFALINARPSEAQLWDMQTQSLVGRYSGHKAVNLVIKSCFSGAEKSFVISGSEDGHVYVYHRGTGKLLERLSGHEGPINSVAWHPTHHALFASASDDSTVRIWTPSDIGRFRALNVSEREAGDALASGRRGAVGAISGVSSRAYGHAASASTSSGPTPFPWERSPHAAASDDDAELSLPAEPSDMFMSS